MKAPSSTDPDTAVALLAAALDAVGEGAAIVDGDGRVLHVNAAFRASGADPATLADGDGACRARLDDGASIVTLRLCAAEEHLYREILDGLDEILAVYDAGERFRYGNRAFHDRFRHLPGDRDVVGTSFVDMVRRAIRAGLAFDTDAMTDLDGYLARRLEEFRSTAIGESERFTLVGDWNLMRLRLSPAGDRVSTRVDITAQKRAQEKLRREKEQLETEAVAQASYVAKLSHELRTPLTAIVGYGEMIEKEMLGPVGPGRYREYAGVIVQSGRRLLALVDKILELSRLEAGRVEMVETTVDLADLLRREISVVEATARENGTLLALNLPGRFPALRGDPRLVRQMVLNLLSNATRFTVHGTVTVSLHRRPAGGIDLVVADDGVGMAPEVLARVGESYYRGPGGPAGGDPGSGLGLAVVKELIALHQGKLSIESASGQGTVAVLAFPPERSIEQ